MELSEIFEEKFTFNGKFTKFYEELQFELEQVNQKQIDDCIKILKQYNPKEKWNKMSKIEILYNYSLIP